MLFGVVTVEELIVVDFLRPPTSDCEFEDGFENEFSEYFFKLLFCRPDKANKRQLHQIMAIQTTQIF